jgi:GAF domain-containing protein
MSNDVAIRLQELRDLRILDTPPDPALDDLVRTAAAVFRAPISLLTLLDEKRQWFKASFGFPIRETPISCSFCAHVALGDTPMVIEDAQLDPRFVDNPLVTGEPYVRFYAGAPLVSSRGVHIGALSVIDTDARHVVAETELAVITKLARLAIFEIESRSRA